MQVEQLEAQGLSRSFKVVLGALDIQNRVAAKLNELQSQVQIKGFRPGKVPLAHLQRTFGKSVLGEVVESAVGEGSDEAIRSAALRPAARPKIEITKFEEGGDLEFKLVVDIMPDIPAVDARTIKLERITAESQPADIDKAIANLRKSNRTFEARAADEPANNGDVVVIDYTGTIEGKLFDGGAAEGQSLELGSGQFIEGFEGQLIGARAGEKREVDVTFPATYPVADLAGKPAHFAVTLHEVKRPVEAELNDEFAKRFNYETIEALREAVKSQAQNELNRVTRIRLKRALLDELDKMVAFPLPQSLVEAEFDQIWKQVEESRQADKSEGEQDLDKERAEFRKIAERRVRLGLLLAEIGKLNNITVSQDEINRAVVDEARRFPGQERQVFEFYNKTPEAAAELRAPLFEEKVVDYLLELAQLTDRVVSRDELYKESEEDDAVS